MKPKKKKKSRNEKCSLHRSTKCKNHKPETVMRNPNETRTKSGGKRKRTYRKWIDVFVERIGIVATH